MQNKTGVKLRGRLESCSWRRRRWMATTTMMMRTTRTRCLLVSVGAACCCCCSCCCCSLGVVGVADSDSCKLLVWSGLLTFFCRPGFCIIRALSLYYPCINIMYLTCMCIQYVHVYAVCTTCLLFIQYAHVTSVTMDHLLLVTLDKNPYNPPKTASTRSRTIDFMFN
jgi:hypothetical protein